MKTKIYKLLSRAKQRILFAIAMSVFSGPAFAQTTYTFNYTGAQQTVALQAGNYSIACWGANGGDGTFYSSQNPNNLIDGGKGGYSAGTLSLSSTTTLYVHVGGRGTNTSSGNNPGGYNGGGNSSSAPYQAGSGGGASHVATSPGILSSLSGNQSAVLIVAGGGGGGGNQSLGGHGGGLSGVTSPLNTQFQNRVPGGGGTQTGGGACFSGGFGAGFGQGGTTNQNLAGGGGGGWYGGCTGNNSTAGGGGSGYIGGVTNGTTVSFGLPSFAPNPTLTGHGLVLITELCSIDLTATGTNSNSAICSGNSVTLTTNAVSGYSWSTGASSSSLIVSPTVTTIYTLGAVSASNCTSARSVTIYVDGAVPSLSIANTASATGGICPTRTVQLSASGATSYSWTSPVINGVPFSPTSPSTYIVTGINACGTSSASTSVSVHPLPNVTAVAGQPSVCSGNPVSLTGVGNATNYVWSNNVANGGNIFPGVTANYTVVGTSVLGCTAQAIVGVTVVTTPQNPPIPNPPLICIGSSATLSSSGATNYTWTTPNGQFNTATIIESPTVTSTYTLTKSNANCFNTQTVSVIVNNLPPVSAIVNPSIVCASKPGTLNAAGASNFTWTSGPPTWSATGAQVIVSPSVSTLYTVTASDGTCANTTTVFLPTNPNPTITIVPSSTAICYGQTATLTVSGANSYSWTTTSVTSNTNSATIVESPLVSTLYNVVGENNFNCTTPLSQVIVVHPNPTLTISSNKPMVCEGAAANLTVTGANTYQWDANAGNATSNIVQVNPLTSTIYTVSGTYTTTQCSSTKTILTTVFLPTFAVNSPTSSCLGGTINLIASGATSYTWNGTQPFSQIAVSPPTETVYVVAATSISLGVTCISTRTVLVSIYNNPTVTAVAERTMICRGETTDLTASGAQTYTWNTNQSGDIVPVGPFNNTTYTVTGIDQNGCIGNTTVSVRVSTCFGIDETGSKAGVHLNMFPNPAKSAFTIKSTFGVELFITNELGQIVKTILLSNANNYETTVSDLASGVYIVTGNTEQGRINEKLIITQ